MSIGHELGPPTGIDQLDAVFCEVPPQRRSRGRPKKSPDQAAATDPPKKRGRPKGSKNKKPAKSSKGTAKKACSSGSSEHSGTSSSGLSENNEDLRAVMLPDNASSDYLSSDDV